EQVAAVVAVALAAEVLDPDPQVVAAVRAANRDALGHGPGPLRIAADRGPAIEGARPGSTASPLPNRRVDRLGSQAPADRRPRRIGNTNCMRTIPEARAPGRARSQHGHLPGPVDDGTLRGIA